MDERSKENEPRENSNNYIVAERVGVYIMTCYILHRLMQVLMGCSA